MSLAVKQMLQERYEIVRNIKSGGMGSVYEAVDHKLASTPCAIKEVLASALASPDASYVLQSFESEMRSLAGLEHPNIPRVRDYFEIEGRRYIVLDLVQGKALDDELADHLRLTHEPMDPAVVAVDMVQVLETLTYLHQFRPPIVHRDIKSANLIRDSRTGRIKLVDFGIARSVETQKVQTQVGTPGFCAPEQMGGRAETRSDIYSVGATLYHLCTGRLPPAFTFDSLEMDLPRHPGLVKIVARATQPKPQDRYGSAEEMASALRTWLRNEGSTKIDPESLPPKLQTSINPLAVPPTPANSQNGLWVAVAAMLLAALGLLYNDYSSRFGGPTPTASPVRKESPQAVHHASSGQVAHQSPKPGPKPSPSRPRPLPPHKPQPSPAKPSPRPASPDPPQSHQSLPSPSPSIGRENSYPTHDPVAHHVQQPRLPDNPVPVANNSVPVATPSTPSGSERFSLVQNDRMYRRYMANIDGYQVNIGVSFLPGHSYQELRDMAMSRTGRLTEHPENERGQEYCGSTSNGQEHVGIHTKNGMMFRITVRPVPATTSPVWGPVMDFIHGYR